MYLVLISSSASSPTSSISLYWSSLSSSRKYHYSPSGTRWVSLGASRQHTSARRLPVNNAQFCQEIFLMMIMMLVHHSKCNGGCSVFTYHSSQNFWCPPSPCQQLSVFAEHPSQLACGFSSLPFSLFTMNLKIWG